MIVRKPLCRIDELTAAEWVLVTVLIEEFARQMAPDVGLPVVECEKTIASLIDKGLLKLLMDDDGNIRLALTPDTEPK